ncbi:hypothetical protein [Wolbachia endosymbiont (group B) of Gerris lacustris]|uniref:hypothetical protein n=1 Tax=Wolbachia endosymbiont (group B) of Gerris lacustris TaxID=3066159 RepID=UPI00333E8379
MNTNKSKKKNIGKIIEILIEEEAKKKARGGNPNKQCMLLIALGSVEFTMRLRIEYQSVHLSSKLDDISSYNVLQWEC